MSSFYNEMDLLEYNQYLTNISNYQKHILFSIILLIIGFYLIYDHFQCKKQKNISNKNSNKVQKKCTSCSKSKINLKNQNLNENENENEISNIHEGGFGLSFASGIVNSNVHGYLARRIAIPQYTTYKLDDQYDSS